jgi:hypothetical protein
MAHETLGDVLQARFEHRKVRSLLKVIDFPEAEHKNVVSNLREASRRDGDKGYLSFRVFFAAERFSSFPVVLSAHAGRGRFELPVGDVLKNFSQTYVHQLFMTKWQISQELHRRGRQDPRPIGVITNLVGIRGGVVLHNADLPGRTCLTTLRHHSSVPGEPPTVTLEPYRALLARAVKRWRRSKPIPSTKPRAAVELKLEAWMVSRFGSGPAAIIMAWLQGVWLDRELRHVVMRNGETWLVANRDLIADATGLSGDAVKRGLATLKKDGMIETQRGNQVIYIKPPGSAEQWCDFAPKG